MTRRSLPTLCVAILVMAAFVAAEVPVVPGTSPTEDVHGLRARDSRSLGSHVVTVAPAPLANAHRSALAPVARPSRRLLSWAPPVLLGVPLKVPRAAGDGDHASSEDD